MDEKRLIELLTRKLAGEASKDELAELTTFLAEHPDALVVEEAFNQIWNLKGKEENTDFFYERHKNKYGQEFRKFHTLAFMDGLKDAGRNRKKYLIGSLPLVIFIVLAGYWYVDPPFKSVSAPAFTRIVSGKGVRKSVRLPDGTNVCLNADSRISFKPGMDGKDARMVDLAGEAYFDVVHIEGRPFIINTDKISIRVLGTAFNVKAYPNEKKCETTLIRGSIELSTREGLIQKFVLRPSEKLSVIEGKTKDSGKTVKGETDNDPSTLLIEHVVPVKLADKEYVPETSWIDNKLIFENESLEDLAPKLERWFNVKIVMMRKNASAERFTGAFANETIEQALTAMKLIRPFNFTIDDKNITIY